MLLDRSALAAMVILGFGCASLKPGTDRADGSVDALFSDGADSVLADQRIDTLESGVDAADVPIAVDVIDVPNSVDVPINSSIMSPQQIAPLTGTAVGSSSPQVRWRLPPGTSAANIELCADRRCMRLLQPPIQAPLGQTQYMLAGVSPGVVFWRLRGRTTTEMGSDTSPTWELINDSPSMPTGAEQPSLLDVNHDGLADVFLGAPTATNGSAQTGRAMLFLGRTGSNSWTIDSRFTIAGPTTGADRLGQVAAIVGDVDGDGFADAMVGSGCTLYLENGASNPACGTSAMSLAYGSATGFTMAPAPDDGGGSLGQSIAGGGDINGDGHADIIIGAPSGNRVMLASIGSDRTATTTSIIPIGDTRHTTTYGAMVANAGDIDGDGLDDVLVGAPWADTHSGQAFVIFGNDGWTHSNMTNFAQIQILPPTNSGAGFGGAVAGVGDVNGDGYGDFVIGTVNTIGSGGGGTAYLYLGNPALGSGTAATPISLSNSGDPGFGAVVSAAGDLNNDGYADFAVASGGRFWDASGAVYVFLGEHSPSNPTAITLMNPVGGSLDGRMGTGLAAAGDVNGDGFGDLIVGAPTATITHGPGAALSGPGAAALFLGNATGVSASPVLLTMPSDLGAMPATFGGSVQ